MKMSFGFSRRINALTAAAIACQFAVACAIADSAPAAPREETARLLARTTLEYGEAGDLQFALSSLWVGERVEEGNQRLRDWFSKGHRSDVPLEVALKDPESHDEALSAALGAVKWEARIWMRIYFLFASDSRFFPGRIASDVQEKFEEFAWAFANHNSSLERSDLKYVWAIQGSENHDMMDLANAFLALQVIKDLPRYSDRPMRDGHSAREHFDAWVPYYQHYCKERATRGLFIEVASPIYGKHFLSELLNMLDFIEDRELQEKVSMLLDVTWADWAVDQLGGVRGGGKTRAYFGHYSERGISDSWYTMANFLFERAADSQLNWAARHGGVEFAIATSSYQLPNVVADIALDQDEPVDFEYISRRPGRMLRPKEVRDRPPLREGTWYHMDPEDPRLVRYSYCTPDYIMGSWFIDPTLGSQLRLEPESAYPDEENYAAISAQSRWQGLIFSTDPNARVFPQCVGQQSRERVNFNQHVAVQHKNVMLVQKHRRAELAGDMRIYFSPGMKERLIERDGYLFLREGNAYLAVGILPRDSNEPKPGYRWEGSSWLYPNDAYAPVVFVTGRSAHHKSLDEFIAHVQRHEYSVAEGKLHYPYSDPDGEETILTLYLESDTNLPEVNGRPIDLSPELVYDSPFLFAKYGERRVTIRKGDRQLVHDFD